LKTVFKIGFVIVSPVTAHRC